VTQIAQELSLKLQFATASKQLNFAEFSIYFFTVVVGLVPGFGFKDAVVGGAGIVLFSVGFFEKSKEFCISLEGANATSSSRKDMKLFGKVALRSMDSTS
jgi:hypothetical protein